MDDLVQKFEKMHLKLAERLENLSVQVEKRNKPYYKPTSSSSLAYTQERDNQTCYRCGQAGHIARQCLSEKPIQGRSQQQPQQQYIKKSKRVNYLTIESSSSEEVSSDEEEPVYVGQKERPRPYTINQKTQKEKVK